MNLFSPIQSVFKSLKGRNHKKFLKKCAPLVKKINEIEQQYQSLSTEKLQEKTKDFMERFQKGETLDDLLPEAFAFVREASKRTRGERHFDK